LNEIIFERGAPTTALLGMSLTTTALVPIVTLSPILIFPTTFAPGQIQTLLPNDFSVYPPMIFLQLPPDRLCNYSRG
jgi:hypothetical protein